MRKRGAWSEHLYQEALGLTEGRVRASFHASLGYQSSDIHQGVAPRCVKDKPIDRFPERWRPEEGDENEGRANQRDYRANSLRGLEDLLLMRCEYSHVVQGRPS